MSNKTYGYIRVSGADQSIDRQIDSIHKKKIDKKSVYIDKQSGKDFERPEYKKMVKKMKRETFCILSA